MADVPLILSVSSQGPTRPGEEAQRLECANTLPKPASRPPPALLPLCPNRSGQRGKDPASSTCCVYSAGWAAWSRFR